MTRAVTIAELGDTNVFSVDGTHNRVGIGSTQPTEKLDVNGVVVATAATVGSAVTINSTGIDAGAGIITATSFSGSGANLTDVISGVELQFGGNSVGTAITQVNFAGVGSVTAPVSGLSTVTINKELTIGVRSGAAVTFTITGNTFNVLNRAGGNTAISV
tara:strand:- start:304 stop:783 length:480 start_codon:yes stop_codon:yes gene_type:complete